MAIIKANSETPSNVTRIYRQRPPELPKIRGTDALGYVVNVAVPVRLAHLRLSFARCLPEGTSAEPFDTFAKSAKLRAERAS